MQSQDFFPTSARTHSRRAPLVPLLLIASVWAKTGLAAWWLTQHLAASEAIPYRAPAVVILLLLSAFEGHLAWKAWRSRKTSTQVTGARWRMFLRWLSVGFVLCYGCSLLVRPQQGGIYLFTIAMTAWYAAVLLPLVGTSAQLSQVVALLQRRWLRNCGWGLYFLLMAPLCSELALRTYAEFFSGPAGASYLAIQQKLPPGSTYGNQTVNPQGYCDDVFTPEPKAGKFRVAALGGPLVLGGSVQEHFLSQIEKSGDDLEIYNFALPNSLPGDFAGQVQREVAAYHPQLVLAFLSPGKDLIEEPSQSAFDWQQLHTLRLGLNLLLHNRTEKLLAANNTLAAGSLMMVNQTLIVEENFDAESVEDAYQTYLQRTVNELMVCRTPIDESMHEHWSRLYGDLERLIATCEKAELPLALVLTPSEFQVNAVLGDVLRRRAGYTPDDLDWELPQRRLATFAQQHQVPLVDLTPHLQLQSGSFARYDVHLSPAGHAVAAEVIGHFVRKRLNTTLAATK